MTVDLFVDNVPLVDFGMYAIDMPELLFTIDYDGDFFPVTCTCGAPGCAGVFRPTTVRHQAGLVRWHVPEPDPPRDLTFDEDQYSAEIVRLVEEGTRLAAGGRLTEAIPPCNRRLFQGDASLRESNDSWRAHQLESGAWRIPEG